MNSPLTNLTLVFLKIGINILPWLLNTHPDKFGKKSLKINFSWNSWGQQLKIAYISIYFLKPTQDCHFIDMEYIYEGHISQEDPVIRMMG